MKIEIKLNSDLCCYSGEVYNTSVDVDVVYDKYGIPYIPAKRIKGCIKEAALELNDMGLLTHYKEIFGEEGNCPAIFSLSNAKIKDYDKIVEEIKSFNSDELCEAQKILNLYTYTRTQTTIDEKTGSAKENSLRTLRVVKKGLTFNAELDFRNKEYLEEFKNAVSMVKHMGVSRTRGLGLVELKVVENSVDDIKHVLFDEDKISDNNHITYTIKLKSPVICKSPSGNQAVTEDYIAGSKVLGLIASNMGRDTYQSIMNDIVASNAYISYDDKRCLPARNSLQKEKNQTYEDGKMSIKDMIYFDSAKEDNTVQRTPAKIKYMTVDNVVQSVETEISYHHQRPDDKSLGHASDNGGAFYQLASISEGQTFRGDIYASKEAAKQIIETVSNLKQVRIGYGKNSEFGQVDFTLDSVDEVKENKTKLHEFDVTLLSDMILFNNQGMLVADVDTLRNYLNDYFNVDDIVIEKPYLSYNTIGGFNVTWGCKKQVFTAIAKGSVVHIKSGKGIDVEPFKSYFVGERISEGYGEIMFETNRSVDVTVYKPNEDVKLNNNKKYGKTIQQLLEKELLITIDELVRDKMPSKLNDEDKAAVSKIRLLYRTADSYTKMKNQFEQLDSSNKDKCLRLMDKVPLELVDEAIKNIAEEYDVDFKVDWSDEKKFKVLYASYINELKNKIKVGGNEDGE